MTVPVCFRDDCKWYGAGGECTREDLEKFVNDSIEELSEGCPTCFERKEI